MSGYKGRIRLHPEYIECEGPERFPKGITSRKLDIYTSEAQEAGHSWKYRFWSKQKLGGNESCETVYKLLQGP